MLGYQWLAAEETQRSQQGLVCLVQCNWPHQPFQCTHSMALGGTCSDSDSVMLCLPSGSQGQT